MALLGAILQHIQTHSAHMLVFATSQAVVNLLSGHGFFYNKKSTPYSWLLLISAKVELPARNTEQGCRADGLKRSP